MTPAATYNFRTPHIPHPPMTPQTRTVMSPTCTATIIRSPGHDCLAVDPDNAHIKVTQRVWHSFFRFLHAFEMQCETWRGKTHLNGSRASCGGCQAGHSCLTPTLYDNKLQMIQNKALTDGFKALSPISRKYLIHRLKLDLTELEKVEMDPMALQDLTNRLSGKKQKGSFVGSEIEKQRNATLQSPAHCNRLDSHLETTLRPKEDTLANQCTTHHLTPEEAEIELLKEHQYLLQTCISNVRLRQLQFNRFIALQQRLIDTQNNLEDFVKAAEEFLNLKSALAKRIPGAFKFNDILHFFFKKEGTYLRLEQVVANFKQSCKEDAEDFYQLVKHSIDLSVGDRLPITNKQREIDGRLVEANAQLEELERNYGRIYQLRKIYLGIKNLSGTTTTPSKEEVAHYLIENSSQPSPYVGSENGELSPLRKKFRVGLQPVPLNFD